jgi:host factor-I protein
MSNHSVNLQDSFLNHVRKDGSEVEMMLVNGTSFKGSVRGFDNFTVVLHVGNHQHLVYKHAIAQIVAAKSIRPAQSEGAEIEDTRIPRQPRGKRRTEAIAAKDKTPDKFNTLDLSQVKIMSQPPAPGTLPTDIAGPV